MDKSLKKAVTLRVLKDVGRIAMWFCIITLSIGSIVGFIVGSIKLASLVTNDYLYLLIVEGFIACIVTLFVNIDHYSDGNYAIYPYLKSVWGRVLHPIINIPLMIGLTMGFYTLIHICVPIFEVPYDRGFELILTLMISSIGKIAWYCEIDPVNLFFYYVDDVIAKENGTYVEPKGRYDEVIKYLRYYENNYNELERRE